jgi:phage minor structural protein
VSYPILYPSTATEFNNNGFGILSDCISCYVTEEANGAFELEMEYQGNGIHAEHITDRSIIKAKVDQYREPQLFRVYAQNKTLSGSVKVYAEHISYDLSGIPVKPFAATNAPAALSGLSSNAVVDCPFEFWTDKETEGGFAVPVPASIRSRLGGVSGSILDVYGGEFEWDNFTVKLHNNRGADRGVQIRYGKNLTDLKQEQNCSAVYTGVYPYWTSMDGNLMELPERIVNAPGTYNFVRIKTMDVSTAFMEKPTEEQLRAYTERYIENNDIGVPKVSLKVSFAQLNQSEEYKHLKLLERVSLFDTVSVVFPALNVSAKAKVVKTIYNVMLDRMESVTLGSVRANIADTIVSQSKEIASKPTKTALEQAREAATEWLTNGKGYAYFRKDDMGNIIDILFLDTPDIDTAVNVLRVGQSGIGFSHNGVNGPYESAWTIDGEFNADFITTGILDANLLKTGVIRSKDGTIQIDLENNKFSIITESSLGSFGTFLGKVVASKDGLDLYGWDLDSDTYLNGLSFRAGNANTDLDGIRHEAESRLFSLEGDLWIYAARKSDGTGRVLRIGVRSNTLKIVGTDVEITSYGTMKFLGKNVTWELNDDQKTYRLVGTNPD